MPLDRATQEVFKALDQSRGKGERRQGYRTVSGLTTDTGLTADEVERVLADHPELFMRSRVPDKRGNSLFRLRGSAAVGSEAIESVAAADPSNVQELAASQLAISNDYYENALHQARQSFRSAIIVAPLDLLSSSRLSDLCLRAMTTTQR